MLTRPELLRSLKRHKISTTGTLVSIFLALLLGVGISELMPENIFIFYGKPILPFVGFIVGIILVFWRPLLLISKEVAEQNGKHTASFYYSLMITFFIFVDMTAGTHTWMTINNARSDERIAQSEVVETINENIKKIKEERNVLLLKNVTTEQVKAAEIEKRKLLLEDNSLNEELGKISLKLRNCPEFFFKKCIDPTKLQLTEKENQIEENREKQNDLGNVINHNANLNKLNTELNSERQLLATIKVNGGIDVKPYDDIYYIMSATTFGIVSPYLCSVLLGILFIGCLVLISLYSPILAPLAEEIQKSKGDTTGEQNDNGIMTRIANFFNPNPIIEPSTITATGITEAATSNWQAGFHDFQPRINGNPDGNHNENHDRTDGNPNREISFGFVPTVPPQPQKKSIKKPAQKGGMKTLDVDKYNMFVNNYTKFGGVMADLMLEFNIPRTTAYTYRKKARKEGKIT